MSNQITVRLGMGVMPTVIAVTHNNTKPLVGGGFVVTKTKVNHVEIYQTKGEYDQIDARIVDVVQQVNGQRDPDESIASVYVDITNHPVYRTAPEHDLNPEYFMLYTGSSPTTQIAAYQKLSRMVMLSEVNRLFKQVSFDRFDCVAEVKQALVDATTKPPRAEADDIAMVSALTTDDLMLGTCLAIYNAAQGYTTPGWNAPIDYSKYDQYIV